MKSLLPLAALLALAFARAEAQAPAPARPVALHPENPHYFLFRGKPAILVGSTEHYGAVLNTAFDYVAYLDALERDRLNLTRTFSGTYRELPDSFNITDNTLAPKGPDFLGPWARSDRPGNADGGNKFDLSKFDDKYFARLKDFVAQAGKRGVVVEYVLFCTLYNDALWGHSPMNPRNTVNDLPTIPRTEVYTLKHPAYLKVQEAFVRKAVAELREFDNVYFEVCNEPYFAGVGKDWQAHIAGVIAEAQKDRPAEQRHLVAQNIANDKEKVEKLTPGVSVLNFHYATPPETVEMNYRLNVPISDDETGFRGKEDVHYRTEGWDFFVAGGAAYNNLDYSFTAKHPAGTFNDFKSPGGGGAALRKQLAAMKAFVEGFDFVKMKPANQVVKGGTARVAILDRPRSKTDSARTASLTVRCLAEPGKQYAVYLRGGAGAELKLDLPAGNYRAQWLNPRTGEFEKTEDFAHAGGLKALSSPEYVEDMALKVVRAE